MKYCKKCGLPENYPMIQFMGDGTCNFCDFYEKNKGLLEDKIAREGLFARQVNEAARRARETGAPYDCIVGLSGGKDSAYIAWQMKHTYGLRVLAVTFQNGFHTEYGRVNIENTLEKLNIPHITMRVPEGELRATYAKSVKIMKNFCGVCFHYMHYCCHEIAGRFGIPLIVNGRTKGQILQSALSPRGIEPFQISRSLREFEYQMFGELVEKLAQRKRVDYLEEFQVTSLSYFAYHDVTEEETMKFLERETGWKRPKSGIPHADCWAHPMAEYLSIVKRGYPIRTGELAVQVRAGELTLEEASEILKKDADTYGRAEPETEEKFYKRIAWENAGGKQL